MKALTWHGKADVRYTDVPMPLITQEDDAIIKITSATICGSDLHLYHDTIPMKKGDIMGHEAMGVVESVGSGVTKFKVGQRVVVSCVIAEGNCEFCQKKQFSLCDMTNPSGDMEKLYGDRISGVFGYSHLTGRYPGGQAEYLRVPHADINCLPVPDTLPDEKLILLSDVLCTAWHANELGGVQKGSCVAIWGAGPIGLASAAWARYRGASNIIIIDSVDSRLVRAKSYLAVNTINFDKEDPTKSIRQLIPGGPDICIDAVGFRYAKSWKHTIEQFFKLETDSIDSLSEAITTVKKGGTVVAIGDYVGLCNHFPIGALMEKSVTLTGGQVFVQKYWDKILSIIESGDYDPSFLITKVMPLEKGAEAYKLFDQKHDDAIKILLKPHQP
jgi:threonine dehydrogenase-like Zn-dependent dehydrogenase